MTARRPVKNGDQPSETATVEADLEILLGDREEHRLVWERDQDVDGERGESNLFSHLAVQRSADSS
jgi:hypothetical protein